MLLSWIFFLSLDLIFTSKLWATLATLDNEQLNYQLGFRQNYSLGTSAPGKTQYYWAIDGKKEDNQLWFVRSDFKILFTQVNELSIDVDQLNLGVKSDNWVGKIGASEYAFGESFGATPFDSINPRDHQCSLFEEARWYKLSVWAADFQYFYPTSSWQLSWIPWPKKAPYTLTEKTPPSEYFLRYGKTFENGLDTNWLIGKHQSRELPIEDRQVWAMSGSGSYAWGDVVWRADWRYVWQEFFASPPAVIVGPVNHWQGGAGVDGTWQAGEGHWGIQVLYQDYRREYWASGLLDLSWWNQKLTASLQLSHQLPSSQEEGRWWARWQLLYAAGKVQGKIYWDQMPNIGRSDQWGTQWQWTF